MHLVLPWGFPELVHAPAVICAFQSFTKTHCYQARWCSKAAERRLFGTFQVIKEPVPPKILQVQTRSERENTSGCCSGAFLVSRSWVIISFVSSSGFSQRASVSEVISLKKTREGFSAWGFFRRLSETPCWLALSIQLKISEILRDIEGEGLQWWPFHPAPPQWAQSVQPSQVYTELPKQFIFSHTRLVLHRGHTAALWNGNHCIAGRFRYVCFFNCGIPHPLSPHSLFEQKEREEANLSH